ncbi:MAG: hypothetical protein RLZZ28_397 [Bacteroidota bacterium]|jgi:hypothetical protein
MKRYQILTAALILLAACGQQTGNNDDTNKVSTLSASSEDSVVKITKDAYLYGFPLVLMDITRRQMTNPAAGAMYAPPNKFRHNSVFPDASFKNVVRPNADTYYSIAWLELAKEPIILSLPDTKARYYMMPMMDAYSNVFASLGTRTTGNKAENFLISGPQWKGIVPDEMKNIQSPTNTVWIIGRTQVNSKDDGAKVVVPLQHQYKLTALSEWGKTYIAPSSVADSSVPTGDPNTIIKNMSIEKYFNYVNELLAKNPFPASDKSAIEKFASIGVGANKKFDINTIEVSARQAVNNVPNEVFAAFDQEKSSSDKLVNGWNLGRKVIGFYGTDYYSRASTAYFGLGANLREDAIYPSCYFDAEGNALNGANKYFLHFDKGKTPPASAFWSLTLYDPKGYFVDNPINRYTLGDRSNLKVNTDGSIDIYIQKNNPGNEKASNWLPAPGGDFNLLLRVYWPKEEMLNRNWNPPIVSKRN